jgi:hypothetical protein
MAMLKEIGSPDFPIWLLGDSNPKNWAEILSTPFDPRHPVRHNIWTSILDVVQEDVYRQARLRVDTSDLYIRNAIEDPGGKPRGNQADWSGPVLEKLGEFRSLVRRHKPTFIFCFGAFSYEFGRRTLGEKPVFKHNHWGARRLGADFRLRASAFDPRGTNIFPLLHVTIARGKFIQSHNYFCDQEGANYFEYVGAQIADILLKNEDSLPVWI